MAKQSKTTATEQTASNGNGHTATASETRPELASALEATAQRSKPSWAEVRGRIHAACPAEDMTSKSTCKSLDAIEGVKANVSAKGFYNTFSPAQFAQEIELSDEKATVTYTSGGSVSHTDTMPGRFAAEAIRFGVTQGVMRESK